jgi:uncharacterized protein YfaP (DUF2135 family)
MATPWWQSWRQRWVRTFSGGRRATGRTRRFRPGLEVLEDRQVPTFVPGGTLLTDPNPTGLATADFNGDGKRDFVVVCEISSGTVNVFLGNGDGSFKVPKAFPAGNLPVAVAVGDFDGDGKRDLVVTSFQGGVSVLFGHGDGTFDAPLPFPTGPNAFSVAVADFNGDHRDDFAMTITGASTVRVFLNTGGHSFSPASYDVGDVPGSVVAGDFNHDNRPDLAVTRFSQHDVAVLLNNGSGSFLNPSFFSVGAQPNAVAVGDVNGDSNPDLVVANYDDGTVSVLLGVGTGNFAAAKNFPAGAHPVAVLVGNFTAYTLFNPARHDVVVVNQDSNTVSLLAGDGTGQFAAPVTFPVGNGPLAVAAADFNRDLRLDLVTTTLLDNTVSVLFGAPDPVPPAPPALSTVQDVTAQVAIRRGRWSGKGHNWRLRLTLRNLSGAPLVNLKVVLQPLGARATLRNASGVSEKVAPGQPFVTVPIAALNPNQSVRLPLVFRAKRKVKFGVVVVETVGNP